MKATTRPVVHYGWIIVLAGCLSIFAAIGLGRFSIGMLLPAMGSSLHLSYSQMGLVCTCNFIGYLAAVFFCSRLQAVLGARRLILLALLLVGISMMLIGLVRDMVSLALLYTLTGIGSGAANIPVMGLVSAWFVSRLRGRAAGFVVTGSGFAILLTGKLIPFFNAMRPDGWRVSWFVLGAIVLVIAVLARVILRNRPQDLGLQQVGADRELAGEELRPDFRPLNKKVILHCGMIYFIFGCTYVIYVTFIVTVLVRHGFSEAAAGSLWSWVGFLSLFSGPVFGTFSDRFGRRAGLMIVFSIQTLAYLLVGLKLPNIALVLSIGSFGIVAWSIPSIMIALVGDLVGVHSTVRVFGFITFILGIGQIVGPFFAGQLAETTGDFSVVFLLAAGLTLVAVLLAARLQVDEG